jgi:hypothetical protein
MHAPIIKLAFGAVKKKAATTKAVRNIGMRSQNVQTSIKTGLLPTALRA